MSLIRQVPPAKSRRRQNLANSEVVLVTRWCRVVNGHIGTANRRYRRLALHPVGIARRAKELVDQRLIRAKSTGYGIVIVIAHADYERVVPCRLEAGCRSACIAVGACSSTDGSRTACPGSIDASERHYREG